MSIAFADDGAWSFLVNQLITRNEYLYTLTRILLDNALI
jgi:hypothetical protein